MSMSISIILSIRMGGGGGGRKKNKKRKGIKTNKRNKK